MKAYAVEVCVDEVWAPHSDSLSYREAQGLADMVHGRVQCPSGLTDYQAYTYALSDLGCKLSWTAWCEQDNGERDGYEFASGYEAEPVAKAAGLKIDLDQGDDDKGRTFGYVHTGLEDDGGYFFCWLPTLDETVDSLDADDVDPPTFPIETAAEFLRNTIAIRPAAD